jgi:hypothetical protein
MNPLIKTSTEIMTLKIKTESIDSKNLLFHVRNSTKHETLHKNSPTGHLLNIISLHVLELILPIQFNGSVLAKVEITGKYISSDIESMFVKITRSDIESLCGHVNISTSKKQHVYPSELLDNHLYYIRALKPTTYGGYHIMLDSINDMSNYCTFYVTENVLIPSDHSCLSKTCLKPNHELRIGCFLSIGGPNHLTELKNSDLIQSNELFTLYAGTKELIESLIKW